MVLAHQSSFYRLDIRVLFVLYLIFGQLQCCWAGQIFTDGLAIINSPQIGNPGHAGSNLPISIDISGNGKLAPDATSSVSSSPTHYRSLDIYLVSAETAMNFTVSSGPTIFTQEGGTVRHIDWQIPKCIPEGAYNLTFYESSYIDGQPYFIITPISIPIDNPSPSGVPCTEGTNEFLGQPQASSPPLQSPFGQGQGPPVITITLSASGGLPFPFPPQVTITQTAVTILVSEVVSRTTITSLAGTSTLTFVETTTVLSTVNPTGDGGDLSGAIPVNAGNVNRVYFWFLLTPFIMTWL
uniref:Uncharacterized protein n=1 Tax=Moniliophthora roreri TaxID=221103 RepID=A0A0W0G2N7_MONRR